MERVVFSLLIQLAFESGHHWVFPELGPHEVALLNVFLVVQLPPEPLLEERPYQHRVVTLANIEFVVVVGLVGLRGCYSRWQSLHVCSVVQIILLFENRGACEAVLVIVLPGHDFAGELEQLLLDGVGLLTHFQEGNGEVVLV